MTTTEITEVALIDALNDAWIVEDELTADELNLLHAVFDECLADGLDATDAARMAVEQMLEG